MYIKRAAEETITKMLAMFKVVLLTGPRQVGKTTLLKHLLDNSYDYVTLDDITELEIAKNDPKLFFINHPGKVIIDEVQYAPELFSEIKRIVDQDSQAGRFVLTGSQSFSLMDISETLAGRIGILELNGLSLREIKEESYNESFIPKESFLNHEQKKISNKDLWEIIHRGSYPALHQNPELDWQLYYASYVKTFIERDVRQIKNISHLAEFSRLITSLAARTGQLLNYNRLAQDAGVNQVTIKSWIGILEASGLIYLLQPFSNNRLKRAIKTPMVYFLDTGLVAYLLRWLSPDTLMRGAMSGPILETFAVSEIIKSFTNKGINPPISFYRDQDQREIDLIIEDEGVLYPIEIKQSASPRASMARQLSLLEKAEDFEVGTKTILSLVEKKTYLQKEILTYPIGEI